MYILGDFFFCLHQYDSMIILFCVRIEFSVPVTQKTRLSIDPMRTHEMSFHYYEQSSRFLYGEHLNISFYCVCEQFT